MVKNEKKYSFFCLLVILGPFGSASEEVFRFQTVMLIGAGIGVKKYRLFIYIYSV